jgi:hypothetical protein
MPSPLLSATIYRHVFFSHLLISSNFSLSFVFFQIQTQEIPRSSGVPQLARPTRVSLFVQPPESMALADEIELKVILVGNTRVGKTCIAKVATGSIFSDETAPTLGASCVSKLVHLDVGEVWLQIWNTAGHTCFRGITPMYFCRGARCGDHVLDHRRGMASRFWTRGSRASGRTRLLT